MLASALGGLSSSTLLNLLVLPALTQRCVRVQSQLQCDEDPLTGSFRPRLCEKARAPFSCVNFSHVDAISGDFSHRIRPLAILRGERKVFSHSLGRKRTERRDCLNLAADSTGQCNT